MTKIVHRKLTEKSSLHSGDILHCRKVAEVLTPARLESRIMEQAAKELLSPRPEAISRILELSRHL